MANKTIPLAHGHDTIELSVPHSTRVLQSEHAPETVLGTGEIRDALAHPTGTDSLEALLRARSPRRVAITISDITRAVPNRILLPPILETIAAVGIPDEAVVIVVGTGMHRPSTEAEHETLVGPHILARYRIVDHRADDPDGLTRISTDPHVAVSSEFAEADFRIVTGFIEPHFMAGFSGGRKGVCPALVDLATVQRFHGYETLASPAAREGLLEGNPCHEIASSIARTVGVDFLCNVAINREKQIVGIYCGDLFEAHERGTRDVSLWNGVRLDETFDIVITSGGGAPLDHTYYQTVKGMCMALPALHSRSTLLIVSGCSEQFGSPEYVDVMTRYATRPAQFIADIAQTPNQAKKDQWQYQMQCRVIDRIGAGRILFVSDFLREEFLPITAAHPVGGPGTASERAQRALDRLLSEQPGSSVAAIPDGPYTMLIPST